MEQMSLTSWPGAGHVNPSMSDGGAELPAGFRPVRKGLRSDSIRIPDRYLVPSHLRSVVFDLNGTIVQSETAYREALRRATESLCAMPIPTETWEKIQTSWHMSDMTAARTVIKALKRVIPELSGRKLNLRPEALIAEQKRIFLSESQTLPLEPVRGIKRLLDEFKEMNVRIGMATGSTRDDVRVSFERLGLHNFFEDITYAVELPPDLQKPHPHAYLKTLREIQVDPKDACCLAWD